MHSLKSKTSANEDCQSIITKEENIHYESTQEQIHEDDLKTKKEIIIESVKSIEPATEGSPNNNVFLTNFDEEYNNKGSLSLFQSDDNHEEVYSFQDDLFFLN